MSTVLYRRSHPFLKSGTHIGFAGKIQSPAKLMLELRLNSTTPKHAKSKKDFKNAYLVVFVDTAQIMQT